MLNLLVDHQSFTHARRALLITSVLTILMSSAQISGDGLNLLGLKVALSKTHILTTLRIAAAYFLWIFCWVTIVDYFGLLKKILAVAAANAITHSEENARSVDNEIMNEQNGQPGWEEEPDEWWLVAWRVKAEKTKSIDRLELTEKVLIVLRGIVVDVLPVFIVGILAITIPTKVSTWIYSEPVHTSAPILSQPRYGAQ